MTRLGELERSVMDVLWSAEGACSARDVADALSGRALAPTTWLTVLSRLERKGLVRRDRTARAHTYRPTASRADHVAELLNEVLDTAPDRTAVLQHFARSISAEEAEALRAALSGPRPTG